MVLVAMVMALVAAGRGHPGAHRTTAASPTTTRAIPGGTFGPSRPGAAPPGVNAPTATQQVAGGTASDAVQIVAPPIGATSSVNRGREVTLVLHPPATGRWGAALITRGTAPRWCWCGRPSTRGAEHESP